MKNAKNSQVNTKQTRNNVLILCMPTFTMFFKIWTQKWIKIIHVHSKRWHVSDSYYPTSSNRNLKKEQFFQDAKLKHLADRRIRKALDKNKAWNIPVQMFSIHPLSAFCWYQNHRTQINNGGKYKTVNKKPKIYPQINLLQSESITIRIAFLT